VQIRKGEKRIVFIFPKMHFAVKLPIIHLFLAIKFGYAKTGRWNHLKKYLGYPMEAMGGFKWFLFRGLSSNWNEICFYLKTRNLFLQPTYFSFFGLLNIQRCDDPCELKSHDLWAQLRELTEGRVSEDEHHFDNPDNFCFRDKKLRMIDYGSKRSHGVLLKYSEKIMGSFDPEYCWEDQKKELEKKGL